MGMGSLRCPAGGAVVSATESGAAAVPTKSILRRPHRLLNSPTPVCHVYRSVYEAGFIAGQEERYVG